jgi:hypothetical protein
MKRKNKNRHLTILKSGSRILIAVTSGKQILDQVELSRNTAHLQKQSVLELVKMYAVPKSNISGQSPDN